MYEMFTAVTALAERWCGEPQNAESFPPIVFNITDGELTDEQQKLLHLLQNSGVTARHVRCL